MYTRHIIPSDKYPMRYEGDTRRRESDSLLKVQFNGETQNYKSKEFYDMDRFIKYNEKIIDVDEVINISSGEYIVKNDDIFGDKSDYDKISVMDKCNINIITSKTDYLALLNKSNIIKQYVIPIIYEDGLAKIKTEITLINNLIFNAEGKDMQEILDVIRTSLKTKEKDTDDTITLEEFTNLMATYYTEKGSGFDSTSYVTIKAISDAYESLYKRLSTLKTKMLDEYYIPYRGTGNYPGSDIDWVNVGYYRYQGAVNQNNIMRTAYGKLISNGTSLPTVSRDKDRFPNATLTAYSSLSELYTDMIYTNMKINNAITEFNKKLPMGLASGVSFKTLINSYASIKTSTDTEVADLDNYKTTMTNFIPDGALDTSKYLTWHDVSNALEAMMASVDNKLSKGSNQTEIDTYNSTYLVKYPNGAAFGSVVKSKLEVVANNTGLKLLPKGTYANTVKSLEDGIILMYNSLALIDSHMVTINNKLADMLPTFVAGNENIPTEFTTAYSSLQTAQNLDGILISFKDSINTLNALDAKFENIRATDPTLSLYRFIWMNMV